MSGKEHEPGPRGSPQLPQAPEAEVVVPPPFVGTAKTESWGARSLLLQLGQTALSRPNTRASNPWWHWLQTYSKIGIIFVLQRTISFHRIDEKAKLFYSEDPILATAGIV
jgi:hypothetical protein